MPFRRNLLAAARVLAAASLNLFLLAAVSAQTFSDASHLLHPVTLAGDNRFQRGASAVDFNNDGRVDIYQSNFREPGNLYLNEGTAGFHDVLAASGIDEGVNLWGAAFGDYNADGYLDIVFEDLSGPSKIYRNERNGTFLQVNDLANVQIANLAQGAAWADFNLDGYLDFMIVNDRGPNQLFKNVNGTRFVDISTSANVQTIGNSYGMAWGDINNDGYPDAYITTCHAVDPLRSINHLLLNNGDETFTNIGAQAGVADSLAGWAPLMLDFDHDGDLDIFVTNSAHLPRPGLNRLYRNEGDNTFRNVSFMAGVAGDSTDANYGASAADFDNDGWMDIYVTNLGRTDRLFHNNGDGTFTDIAAQAGVELNQHRTVAVADFNGDGWLDIFTAGNPANRLLYNDGGEQHWLRIRTRGAEWNYHGVGTRIEVYAGTLQQTQEIQAGDGFCQQNHNLSAHFGLGAQTRVDSIVFKWPGGHIDRLFDLTDIDREVTMIESQGLNPRPTTFDLLAPANGDTLPAAVDTWRFTWANAADPEGQPLTYTLYFSGTDLWTGTTSDTSFVVAGQNEIEIPAAFLRENQAYIWSADVSDGGSITAASRPVRFLVAPFGQLLTVNETTATTSATGISASAAWIDVDGNGFEDLFVGNPGRKRNFLFLNDGGSFVEVTSGETVTEEASTFSAGWADFNNDGLSDLFIANAANENNVFYLNLGGAAFTRVDEDIVANDGGNSLGCCWADYDNDGYVDLYVANTSNSVNFLYRNLNGTAFAKVAQGEIVTEALTSFGCSWSDYDNDGDADLFVANSGANSLFENNGDGTFEKNLSGAVAGDQENSRGGSWGDFDNDGDFDLYVTNLGPNTLYENKGDGSFDRLAAAVFAGENSDSRGAGWADYDNDGNLDLFVGNAGEDRLILNPGSGDGIAFPLAEVVGQSGTTNAVASADFDNDGDLDIFLADFTSSSNNVLLENTSERHNWLQVKCIGVMSNKAAIGTRVRLKSSISGGRWQMREVSSQTGFSSQNGLIASFGLARVNIVDSLLVQWPSGRQSTLTGLAVNQLVTISEDSAVTSVADPPPLAPSQFSLGQNFPNPFNPGTTIQYRLPEGFGTGTPVLLQIYNIKGQLVRTLVDQQQLPGLHTVRWNGTDESGRLLGSGLYVYRLALPGVTAHRKMLLLK